MEGEQTTSGPARSRSVIVAFSTIEFIVGSCLLLWAIGQLHSNGWSLLFKAAPGTDVHLVAAGMIILSFASGLGLLIGAAGLMFVRKSPFVFHLPLVVFWAYVVYRVTV